MNQQLVQQRQLVGTVVRGAEASQNVLQGGRKSGGLPQVAHLACALQVRKGGNGFTGVERVGKFPHGKVGGKVDVRCDAGCRVGIAVAGGASCALRVDGGARGALVFRFAESPGLQPQPVRVETPAR